MDSPAALAASSGAFYNVTSFLTGTLANLTTALHGSNEYVSTALGVHPSVVYSGLAAIAAALPLTMSRYGWSTSQTSPYAGGAQAVKDEDFDYITSQDLHDPVARRSSDEPDDVLLIKNKGATYPAHFPAFAIGDGKLRVEDVRDRVGLLMDLSEKGTRRVKLLYKGRQLKSALAPVRDYGVKNKSELMAVLPEVDDGSSPSEEEMVVVDQGRSDGKPRKKKKRARAKKAGGPGDGESASSPRDSASTLDPPRSPNPATSGPMKIMDDIAIVFTTTWLPLCDKYVASPPPDPKKREEEHRRLTESMLAQIILKLDAVETEGIQEVRTRRKDLVNRVQETMKRLDKAKDGKR